MFYLILVVLFILVFAFITWRIFRSMPPARTPAEPDRFVCTVCNNRHCDCHKETDGE